MKTCLDCGAAKPLNEFPPAAKRSDGRGSYCRPCMRERHKASYRSRQRAQGRTVREKAQAGFKVCPDCQELKPVEEFPRTRATSSGLHPYCKPCHTLRCARQRKMSGPGDYHRKYRYGLEPDEYQAMLEEQYGLCAICQKKPAEHVDHDHESGAVRGLLCFNCNGGLGQFRDRVDILKKAIAYLERTRDSQWQTSDCTDGSLPPTRRRGPAPSPTSYEQLHLSC